MSGLEDNSERQGAKKSLARHSEFPLFELSKIWAVPRLVNGRFLDISIPYEMAQFQEGGAENLDRETGRPGDGTWEIGGGWGDALRGEHLGGVRFTWTKSPRPATLAKAQLAV